MAEMRQREREGESVRKSERESKSERQRDRERWTERQTEGHGPQRLQLCCLRLSATIRSFFRASCFDLSARVWTLLQGERDRETRESMGVNMDVNEKTLSTSSRKGGVFFFRIFHPHPVWRHGEWKRLVVGICLTNVSHGNIALTVQLARKRCFGHTTQNCCAYCLLYMG